jgi:hypothetical protein
MFINIGKTIAYNCKNPGIYNKIQKYYVLKRKKVCGIDSKTQKKYKFGTV